MKYLFFTLTACLSLTLNALNIVNQKDLQIKNGKYYLNANRAFSGISASYFSNGKVESYTKIKNGSETGEFEIFFNSGSNRIIVSKLSIKDTKAFSIEVWNEDSTLAFVGEKIEGVRYRKGENKPFSGTIFIHYLNGTQAETANFINGKWHGKQIRFNREGVIEFECIFDNNEIVDCPIYNKNE